MTRHPGRRRQSGQAIVLAALAMLTMVASMSLVILGGALYVERRQVQELADGAALAGAAQIPCSGQNAYAVIDGLVSLQLGVTPALSQTLGGCGSSSTSWSRTYPDGTQLTAAYPYVDASRIQVSIVSAQVSLPLGGVFGASQSTVGARAVARGAPATSVLDYALYVQNSITCAGSAPVSVSGSVYSGAAIDSHCNLYAHAITGFDQGNVFAYLAGQQWQQGGGWCSSGAANGNVICADGYEISASQCPSPRVTDFLGVGVQGYPCPSASVPAPSIIPSAEPNADGATVATIGGTACDPNGQAAVYPLLYARGATAPIGRLRPGQAVVNGMTVSNAPYRDASGYYHVRPGCYGWLDVSQVQKEDSTARPALVFDPGFYYFSGYFQSSDGDPSAGGLCLGSGGQALGKDVVFEFTSTIDPASFSNSTCAPAPSSSSTGSFGANPSSPVVDGTHTQYGYLAAPCDPTVASSCPLPAGSSWCDKTDAACSGILIWAPSGPPGTSPPAIDGTFFIKGPSAVAYLYGGVFWPGSAPGSPGCQWAANGTLQITGALVCLSLQQQGDAVSRSNGIFYAQTVASTTGGRAALTE